MRRRDLIEKIASHFREILKLLGEDINREGLRRTPERVARVLVDLTTPPKRVELKVQFTEQSDMVICRNIPFFTLCEHHLLPFFGRVHIAYIPRRRVFGASKLVRLVYRYSHRLQIQERMTSGVADELWENLQGYGVMVIIEATHLCMKMRGLPGDLVTSACRGVFLYHEAPRMEALRLIYGPKTLSQV